MQLKISHKLTLLAIVPIITLLIFAIIYINDKYIDINKNAKQLLYAKLIKNASSSMRVLQIERGLSTSYLAYNSLENNHQKLQQQYKNSDIIFRKNIASLKTLNIKILSKLQLALLDGIHASIGTLDTIRERLLNKKITSDEVFNFYTNLDKQILDLITSLNIYLEDELIQNKVFALYKLLELQEVVGQERAHICTFDTSKPIPRYKLQKFYSLKIVQGDLQTSIFNFFHNTDNRLVLTNILNDSTYFYINKVRKSIENYDLNKKNKINVDLDKWFKQTTDKIEAINSLSIELYSQIIEHELNKQTQLNNSLIIIISLTLITILFLIFSTYTIVRHINISIFKLSHGVQDFFEYLEFKKNKPQKINLCNNDEIGMIAYGINHQIDLLKKNQEEDQSFINEATYIVSNMKDGNFKQKSISSPNNPHLKDLQKVLRKLILLITKKIDEQTKNLEALNFSLEDKVLRQTHELQVRLEGMLQARDKAEAIEKSKDDFLANVSHEIRTPLNAILGFVNILQKHTKDEHSLKYLNIIDDSSNSLLSLINDILDFSKIQSPNFSINPHIISPTSECGNAMMLFATKAYEKNITYAIYLDPNIPNEISIDAIRVKQIITNLISNAIKFTPKGGEIKVKVSIKDETLKVSVKDNGIGISEENQEKIFKAFEQANDLTTREYGGTGLGLSISSKLTSLMGGELSIKSQEGKGATFSLIIPIEVIDNKVSHNLNNLYINKTIKLLKSSENNLTYVKLLNKYLDDYGFNKVEIIDKYETGYDLMFFFENEDAISSILASKNKAINISNELNNNFASNDNISQILIPFFGNSIFNAIDKAFDDT